MSNLEQQQDLKEMIKLPKKVDLSKIEPRDLKFDEMNKAIDEIPIQVTFDDLDDEKKIAILSALKLKDIDIRNVTSINIISPVGIEVNFDRWRAIPIEINAKSKYPINWNVEFYAWLKLWMPVIGYYAWVKKYTKKWLEISAWFRRGIHWLPLPYVEIKNTDTALLKAFSKKIWIENQTSVWLELSMVINKLVDLWNEWAKDMKDLLSNLWINIDKQLIPDNLVWAFILDLKNLLEESKTKELQRMEDFKTKIKEKEHLIEGETIIPDSWLENELDEAYL